MKDELKEILNWLNQIIKENKESDVSLNSCVVPFETLYKLQDCITNLEQENEELNRMCEIYSKSLYNADLTRYKSRNEKAIEILEQDKASASFNTAERIALNILNGGDDNE